MIFNASAGAALERSMPRIQGLRCSAAVAGAEGGDGVGVARLGPHVLVGPGGAVRVRGAREDRDGLDHPVVVAHALIVARAPATEPGIRSRQRDRVGGPLAG